MTQRLHAKVNLASEWRLLAGQGLVANPCIDGNL
jgi:hypothetical protein